MLKAEDLKPDSRYLPNKIYGIDFSGAKNAGSKIWITSAITVGNELRIDDCYQAKDLPDSAAERDRCLGALRSFISVQKACAFGLDFPFSLPKKLIKTNSWEEFILAFANRYPDAEQFRKICWVTAGNREERRDTDEISQTPLSVYNLRLFRQTYFGIRDILAPLVRDKLASVLPMQSLTPDKPWLIEVCPASTLRQMRLPLRYKNIRKENRAARTNILEGIEKTGIITLKQPALRAIILDDPGGDALDSVIAAFATFRAIGNPACFSVPKTSTYALEGYVYV